MFAPQSLAPKLLAKHYELMRRKGQIFRVRQPRDKKYLPGRSLCENSRRRPISKKLYCAEFFKRAYLDMRFALPLGNPGKFLVRTRRSPDALRVYKKYDGG